MPFSSENQPKKRCKGKLARKEKRGTKDEKLVAARDAAAEAAAVVVQEKKIVVQEIVHEVRAAELSPGGAGKRKRAAAERAEAAMVREKDDLSYVLSRESRQHAIAYQYIHIMQGPVKEDWDGPDGTINSIMHNLEILKSLKSMFGRDGAHPCPPRARPAPPARRSDAPRASRTVSAA